MLNKELMCGGGNKSELEYTHLWTIGQQEAVEYTEYGYSEGQFGSLVPNDFRGLVYRTTGGELLTGGYIASFFWRNRR